MKALFATNLKKQIEEKKKKEEQKSLFAANLRKMVEDKKREIVKEEYDTKMALICQVIKTQVEERIKSIH